MSTFIIADKSQLVLEVLEFTVEQQGFKVFTAKDTQTIKKLYSGHRADFVIMSQELEDGDGIELARELLEIYPSNILIMSNTQNSELKRKAKAIGVVGWILKPFIPSHLIRTVIKTFLES